MSSNETTSSRRSLTDLVSTVEQYAVRYAIILFLLLIVAVYGFVLLRITSYSNAQPSDTDVSAEVKAFAVPHIPTSAVDQMQSLQDHSVSVKSLFDAARNNPFQE